MEESTRSSTPERVFSRASVGTWQTPTPPRSYATPPSSAGRRQVYSDRYIPSRTMTNLEDAFDILDNKMTYRENNQRLENMHDNQSLMNNLLRSELLGESTADLLHPDVRIDGQLKSPPSKESTSSVSSASSHLFKYRPSSLTSKMSLDSQASSSLVGDHDSMSTGSIASPARRSSLTSGSGSGRAVRKIPKTSFKTLDAPSLQDDYYLNLLDWSSKNLLAVALSNAVYLWSAATSKVVKLMEFDSDFTETVTSISFCPHCPQYLAVGSSFGRIHIWDVVEGKLVRELRKHESRVGALSWSGHQLASGSRDRSILLQDIRVITHPSSSSTIGSGSSQRARRLSAGSSSTSTPSRPVAVPAPSSDAVTADPLASSSASTPMMLSSTPPRSTHLSGWTDTTPPQLSFPWTEHAADPLLMSGSGGTRMHALRSVFAPPLPPTAPGTADTSLLWPSSTASATAAPPTASSSSSSSTGGGGSSGVVHTLRGHTQEVCGLKWSFDDKYLASGGNDNKLFIWDARMYPTSSAAADSATPSGPLHRFQDHTAAVKAVAWSPHQAGLLASGGGTADRHIRFWNAQTGLPLHKIDTCSQVCNLMWSKTVNEIVSTHGFSLNQVIVWKYPSMQKLATLTGHTMRVLYLAMSPDGQTVVTGAGDESLRFWNIFPPPRSRNGLALGQSVLMPSTADVR